MLREEVLREWKDLKDSIVYEKQLSDGWFDLKIDIEVIIRKHTNLPHGASNKEIIKALEKLLR